MLRTKTRRLIAIYLAFLMLFSSVGYSLDMHFCQGEIKNLAIFGPAKTCSELEVKNDCHFHSSPDQTGEEIDQEKCCSDKSALLEMDLDYTTQTFSLATIDFVKVLVKMFCWHPVLLSLESSEAEYLNYRPPLILSDALVLYQVFLI